MGDVDVVPRVYVAVEKMLVDMVEPLAVDVGVAGRRDDAVVAAAGIVDAVVSAAGIKER